MRLTISPFLLIVYSGAAVYVDTAKNEAKREVVMVARGNQKTPTELFLQNEVNESFTKEKEVSKRHKRQVWKDQYATQPGSSTVYYRFDSSIDETIRQAFVNATKLWEAGTCLEFKENGTATEGILVTQDLFENCYTDSDERNHIISLCEACSAVSDMAHEIGHALGLPHMQNRRDRDNYIIVNWTNVKNEYNAMALSHKFDLINPPITLEEHEKQYIKMEEDEEAQYGIPYDLGSIMQRCSKGGKQICYSAPSVENATIFAKDKNYNRTMGSPFVSFIDRLLVNKHYKCTEICSQDTSAHCENNGFPNPKDCSSCFCPKGFGGKLCERRPDGCGQDLTAGEEWQTMSRTIYNPDNNGEYAECTIWILAEHGGKIEVRIVSISSGLNSVGCEKAGIEIKTKNDTRLTGYRFCSHEDTGISLETNSTFVPVIMYSKVAMPMEVNLNYRAVSSTPLNSEGLSSSSPAPLVGTQ